MSNINITIFDYTNNQTVTGYALSACPFTFVSTDDVSSNYSYSWDFGDGTTATGTTVSHTYLWEGVYPIKLTATSNQGVVYTPTFTPVVSVYNFIDNTLQIPQTITPFYDIIAGEFREPIIVNRYNSWQYKQDTYTLTPYVSGALGDYLDVTQYNSDQWSHLNSYNKFVIKQPIGNTTQLMPTNTYTTTDTSLYAVVSNNSIVLCNSAVPNSFFVGSSGYAQIYFTSDIPKNFNSTYTPIILFVSQDYSKFSTKFTTETNYYNSISAIQYVNTKPAVLPNIKIRNNTATKLSFSTNGIDSEGTSILSSFNIPSISWKSTPIPFVVKLKDVNSFSTRSYAILSANNSNQKCTSYLNCISTVLVNSNNTIVQGVSFYTDYIPYTDFSNGGYFKGYFISPVAVNNCMLSATVNIQPAESFNLDTVGCFFYSPSAQTIYGNIYTTQYSSKFELLSSSFINRQLTIPIGNTLNNTKLLSSISPLYVSPVTLPAYKQLGIWMIDENKPYIYCFDIFGNKVYSINLSAAYYKNSYNNFVTNPYTSGSYINFASGSTIPNVATKYSGAIDSANNLWVSLFGNGNIIRYNSSLNYIDLVVRPFADSSGNKPLSAISGYTGQASVSSTNYSSLTGASSLYVPVSINIDSYNNLWAGYMLTGDSKRNGLLVQYTSSGNINKQILLPQLSVPRQLDIDKNNNVNVVVDMYTNTPTTVIYRYTNTGTIQYMTSTNSTSLPGLSSETLATDTDGVTRYVDTTQNIIYIPGINSSYALVDDSGNVISDEFGDIITFTGDNLFNPTLTPCASGIVGVFCDTYTRTNYVNTLYNCVSSSDQTQFNLTIPMVPIRGDVSGFSFINKFYHTFSNIYNITGQSNRFNILSQNSSYYTGKVNEDFDANSFYNNLRLQESLLDKDIFFNTFLGTIVGNISSDYTSLGKTVYEKIANFTDNNANIDRTNIQSLISQCIQYNIPYENINYSFPPDLQKVIDLLSINFTNLRGTKNNYNQNFTTPNSPSNKFGINLGSKIDVNSGAINAYEKIVAYEKYSNKYKLIQSAYQQASTLELIDDSGNIISDESLNELLFNLPYTISQYSPSWGWGLVLPPGLSGAAVQYYYDFYRFVDTSDGVYYDNSINWNDILTTTSIASASYNDWVADDGIMDQLISRGLINGLNLLT